MSRKSFDIDEARRFILARDKGRCQYCGRAGWQLAHKIPQDKLHLKRYGEAVIYHYDNMTLTCDRDNFRAEVDYRTRPLEAERIAQEIRAKIEKEN